jgi:sugar phosphate isomerase/epimerase
MFSLFCALAVCAEPIGCPDFDVELPRTGIDYVEGGPNNRTKALLSEKLRMAFQVYAVRDLCEKDFAATLKAVKALGYEGVETGRFYGLGAKALKTLLAETGLELVALQLYPDDLVEPKLRRTLEFAKECGADRINVAWFKGSSENFRDWQLLVEVVNHAAEVAAGEGIAIGYHNHDQEFRIRFDGKYAWDWLWERFSPLVKQEFDAGWCALAGVDPLEVLSRYPGRNPTVHVMPAIHDVSTLKPGEAGVGSRLDAVDWPRLLSRYSSEGTGWLVVKPVAFPDSIEDLKASGEYLKTVIRQIPSGQGGFMKTGLDRR